MISAEIQGYCFICQSNVIAKWLRHQTHMEWSSYQFQSYKVLESIHMQWMDTRIHLMPLPCRHIFMISAEIQGYCASSLSSDWGSRSTWNGPHIHNRNNQGVGEHSYAGDWHHDPYHAIVTMTMCPTLGICWNPGLLLYYCKQCHCQVIEAPDPHAMIPISIPDIYKVLESIHMLWMETRIHLKPVPPQPPTVWT